ncbi:prolipoprotein diacylglyceryl transferase [Salinibacterium sp. NSLL150]|uniref:prolipoprotein diacylglyceryl transferase n=1 Tax=unclassified Salinibacterium TaxID=2632331 RepID=UPI0018CDBEBE|nr:MULTISPECIES: prolipoprotein diacylglyceryl transferase [unclassified Salinibacterium]MBH0024128.1 prolipoprotein diacylglyceryl transferase [Salinibacterium sp. SWN248]MBH0099093.1 prolipoprotein diacylglyceryl transferase [Salinibacterium sp. NSLL35]MBH0101847.1 prolipoprotein diacylglyceryl transferase [Salinibacterium sp. NSLL150]MBH0104607.1 prolipoprotein diacylglyceryl transferase [Salinibacterium sp. NSLL16]MBH0107367.1 prolipoprotein diacylglyceryl transferase [Salinibacterium sp. 
MPLSIPSPPDSWATLVTLPFGQWFSNLGLNFGGTVVIHTYAICILIGIIAATWLTSRRLTRHGAEPGIVIDIIIWAVPLGLVGARLYHVFTHPGDYFYDGADPWEIIRIWNGGNAIFGSLIGGAVGAYIGARLTGIRFWSFADALAPAILLAQAIGRLGNYFNHELFGQPTALPWGLEIEAGNSAIPVGLPVDTLFHPTFLYEMVWNVVGIVFLLTMERQYGFVKKHVLGLSVPVFAAVGPVRLQWGKVWALYMIWYGVGRSWFESIRIDPSEVYFGLRVNVWGAILTVALGILLYVIQSRRHVGREKSAYVDGHVWSADGVVNSDERYSEHDIVVSAAEESAPVVDSK